ncbi:MAG: TAXI family TRAP transporter solute-binding subunit [Woeseiaceae bacterium]
MVLSLSAVVLVSGCGAQSNGEAPSRELHLATASLGGAFYPVGQSASNLVTKYADGLTMLPVVSAGAIQNPRLVHAGEVDLGITNGNMAWLAVNGTGPYAEPLNLKAVGTLHPSILHMVTLKGAAITSFDGLRGKRVAVGPAGGGTYAFLVRLLEVHGMTIDDITPSYLSYTDGFTQLGDGNVDAALALAGFPTAAVMQTLATHELAFIRLSDEYLATMLERYPYYTSRSLPKEVYRLDSDVVVIGVNNMLIVNANMAKEDVFAITTAIYGNMDEFRRNNAIARQIDVSQSLSLPVPLHDGAAQFFKIQSEPGVEQ